MRLRSPGPILLTAIAVAAATLVLSACGGSVSRSSHASAPDASTSAGTVEAAEIAVVKAWATDLRSGNVTGAASYFALPSVFVNGVVLRVRTAREARIANEMLSCGARYVSAQPVGRYLNVLFTLTNRVGPGAGCGSGVGASARTDFLFSGRKITAWVRAPATAPRPGTPPPTTSTPSPTPTVPSVSD